MKVRPGSKAYRLLVSAGWAIALAAVMVAIPAVAQRTDSQPTVDAPGCGTTITAQYPAGFVPEDFDLTAVRIENGSLVLDTGNQAINPERIVIPFEQEVRVSFLYEDAGWESTLGWIRYRDAVDANGNFLGWDRIPAGSKNLIFSQVNDDREGKGGDGVLDKVNQLILEGKSEDDLPTHFDGTPYPFEVDGDKKITPRDMKKNLGTFQAGEEIVFYLDTNPKQNARFYTKKAWNPDTFRNCTTTSRTYLLDQPSSGDCDTPTKGLLDKAALDRLKTYFGITLSGSTNLVVTRNAKFPHVIVAAPAQDPNQWILTWEDVAYGGDMDYNDMTFRIERKAGGVAALKAEKAVVPVEADAYFTAVTFEVYDEIPGEGCSNKTSIAYELSIDGGKTWVKITDWDEVRTVEYVDGKRKPGALINNWTPGNPDEQTYRSARIDFAGLGKSGRQLLWRASMTSDKESCVPRILEVSLTADVATHVFFSRASPVMLANLLYSGSYETPMGGWLEKRPRGHLEAIRLYDPDKPAATAVADLWDAGEKLAARDADTRRILFPDIRVLPVKNESLTLSPAPDGVTRTFTGRLGYAPLVATTLDLRAGSWGFRDEHTDSLTSDWGSGTINRGTGEFTITFNSPPDPETRFRASYSYYVQSRNLLSFSAGSQRSQDSLALDNSRVVGSGFRYDFNQDGAFTTEDHDWLINWTRGKGREWKLGAVDHSTPAVLTAPGIPLWYYGTDITEDEEESYRSFRVAHANRNAVLFVGARDGMLHAFNAGRFRWDDPQAKDPKHRGYFEKVNGKPDYGTGAELWAFIPANLLPRLKNNVLRGDDQAYVDASPALADVKINGQWRSIVMAAEGNGGDSVFCLDVTDPVNPQFLWEYSDPDLFRSRSSPAIGQIGLVMVNGQPRWAAFFVSGRKDEDQYPSVYALDVADGSLISRIFLDSDPGGKGGVPSGQTAIVDTDGNGYIDRIYVGTDKGRMYKVDLADNQAIFAYPMNDCVINGDFDAEVGAKDAAGNTISSTVPLEQRWHPIYAAPAVAVKNNGVDKNVRLFFGTGDSPYFNESIDTGATTYHFFAYNDKSPKGVCDPSQVHLEWFIALPAGHRVFASAFSAAGKIYFGTSTSETENPCDGSNQGKLFIVDEKTVSVTTLATGDITSAPTVEDEHLFLRTRNGLSVRGGKWNNAPKSAIKLQTNIRAWRELRN